MPAYTRRVELPGRTSDELFTKVSKEITHFLEKASIGKCDVTPEKSSKKIAVKGSMFSADLKCGDGFLELNVNLSLFAAPFRGKLDEGIDRWLAKAFPAKA